jgi:ribonucleoside-diphosphate reductase alpha chain
MYQTLKESAMVFKSGGGVGYNFSMIRPKGSLVMSTKGKASGVVELVKLYNASSNMVMQGGVRRGASIGILNIDHPEIIDFINAKREGDLTNFNLSIGITDAFMDALTEGKTWQLVFNGNVYNELPAQELWSTIIEAAHSCGDPGLIFLDRLNDTNTVPPRLMNATNPCGELPLSAGESCLLGSINLANMVNNNKLDEDLLAETVSVAVRFLDNILDVAQYPLPLIAESTLATRKIGLGFTGLADALIKLITHYDSPEGRAVAENISKLIRDTAHTTSNLLAEEKGCFPLWEESVFHPEQKRRNAVCLAIAPTGSVTTMAGCEGYGVEPIFAVAYTKSTNVAGDFEVFSPLFLEACEKHSISKEAMSIVAKLGSCQGVEGIPEEIQQIFKGAQDIKPEAHLLMQAAVQKYVDSAVSKTINLPQSATIEDIDNCFRQAYKLRLKGITIFRDGCKEGAVKLGQQEQNDSAVIPGELKRGDILSRPERAVGLTQRLDSGCGKIYLTVNYQPDSGKILETFITTGSDGGCLVYTEATSRLISLAIRGGISVKEIIGQLNSTHSCPSYMMAKGKGKNLSAGSSCASAIANKLTEVIKQINGHRLEKKEDTAIICAECGQPMVRAEGCVVCRNCGYSHC